MLAVLSFIVILLVLVLIHEAGHALAARAAGCRVEEFGFGLPPKLAGKRVGETLFSLNALPIGGFVRLTGEDAVTSADPRSFAAKSRLARGIVLAAGVAGNLVLAVAVFTLVAGLGTDIPANAGRTVENRRVEIVSVRDTPPLRAAGVLVQDAIVAVNGEPVADAAGAAARIREFSGETLTVQVRRQDEPRTLTLHFDPPKNSGDIVGLSLLDVGTVRVPWRQAPLEGLRMTGRVVQATWSGITRMIREAVVSGKRPEDLTGPVGIAALTTTVAKRGFVSLLELTGVLSVNLALVNALPIPALDGGRILFLVLDALGLRMFRGRPERYAHTVGFVVLLLLLALITVGDIQRLTH